MFPGDAECPGGKDAPAPSSTGPLHPGPARPQKEWNTQGDDDSKELQGPAVGVPALRSTSRGLAPRLSKGSLSASGQGGVRPEGLGLQTPELMLRSAAEQAGSWTHTDVLCRTGHRLGRSSLWFQQFSSVQGPTRQGCVCVSVCVCVCVCECM